MTDYVRLFAITVMVCLVAAVPAQSFVPKTVQLRGDTGGEIGLYAAKVATTKKQQSRVKFDGRCESACTLYLSLQPEKLCVTRNARFGFHAPYGSSAAANANAADYLMASYPGWVRSWIKRKGGLSADMIYMDHGYASKHLGYCQT